jgi:hypothetical protein
MRNRGYDKERAEIKGRDDARRDKGADLTDIQVQGLNLFEMEYDINFVSRGD